jgi:Tol biopolymer transport system component
MKTPGTGAYSGKVRGLVLVGLLVAATAHGAAAEARGLRLAPTTLATVRGYVEGFAQDGNHVVWANPSAGCRRSIVLLTLSTHHSTFLDAKDLCKQTSFSGEIQPWMALATNRALWAYESASLSHYNYSLFTAAPGERMHQTGAMSIERDPEAGGGDLYPVPVAGHGRTLVFADINTDGGEPSGVYRVVGKQVQPVAGTELAFSVAVAGSRFALARTKPAGCVCNDFAAWSSDSKRIAFLSRATGAPQLLVMNADGTDARKLLDDATTEFAWSPDGRALAASQQHRVVIVDSDGGGARTVVPAPGTNLAWSPDGSRLAYLSDKGHLIVVHTEGGAVVDLGQASYQTSQWSPDGRRIAYTRSILGEERDHVFVTAVEGGTPVDLGVGNWPQWASDGSLLAMEREDGEYAVSPDGSTNRRLGPIGALSPDWKWLAYGLHSPDKDYPTDLWIVPTAGGTPRLLAHANEIRDWAWSPDGRAVAYLEVTQGGDVVDPAVKIVDVESGERRVTAPDVGCFPPTWSPDSTRLVCNSHLDPNWEGELAVIDMRIGTTATVTHTEPEPPRMLVEVRTSAGKLVSSFDTAPDDLGGIAWGGSRFAFLIPRSKTQATIEIRSADGKLLRSANVPRPWFDQFAMSGRWLVFRAGHTVRLLDAVTVRPTVLARAPKASIVGLSIDGRRVAWAESTTKRSRIRAVVLPQ